MRRFGVAAAAVLALVALGASPAGAQTAPSVVVTPATGLVNGQTVSITATGFLAVSSSGGTFVPNALQCAPQFPTSAIFDLQTATTVVGPLLTRYCTSLGQFPVTQSEVTSRNVTVSRSFVAAGGTSIACGAQPGDCLIVVVGVRPVFAALASMPISFATPPTTKAACRDRGWQHLTDAQGRPFRNQGQCISSVVHQH